MKKRCVNKIPFYHITIIFFCLIDDIEQVIEHATYSFVPVYIRYLYYNLFHDTWIEWLFISK